MNIRRIAACGIVAGLYAAIALALPATAFANYRLATALYLLASFDPGLVPGLALGNALAGIPQGPMDVLLGGMVGYVTASCCAAIGWKYGAAAILVVPSLLVPLWLAPMFHAPYWSVVVVVAHGQFVSACLAVVVVHPVGRRLWKPSISAPLIRGG